MSALVLCATSAFADTTITLVHFSDYHSHARPFFSEGRTDQGGIARAVAYLRAQRKSGAFVFSGGDMINKGSPAWSDKYGCAEWPWFNGVVDAMAYGNHDGDYGSAEFQKCRSSIHYPILGSNVLDAAGRRVFDVDGKPYLVLQREGVRVGIFALAGSDFEALVKPANRPTSDAKFDDRIAAAREVVNALRSKEHVDLVVLIGHEHREEDEALARAVSGIDIIFGSHSHIKDELHQIGGTKTWYVSPYQYLTYITRLRVRVSGHKVVGVSGGLVRVDSALRADADVARQVDRMQKELESDPTYAPLFRVIGSVKRELLLTDQLHAQTDLGRWIMDIVRRAAHADVALSTTSSFRQPIAPGPLTVEGLRTTLPYPNKILIYELSSADFAHLVALSNSKKGTDTYGQFAGVDPSATVKETSRIYKLATTDYIARVAPGYREFFANRPFTDSGLEVRDEVQKYVEAHSPVP